MKKIIILLLGVFLFTSCGISLDANNPEVRQWRLIEKSAEGSTVTMHVQHSDERAIEWFRKEYANFLKNQYDIQLQVIEISLERTMDQLINEKQNEVLIGSVDLIVLENEGFRVGYDKNIWYGPFVEELPHYNQFLHSQDPALFYRESLETKGYSLAYGQKQLAVVYNRDVFFEPPFNYAAFEDVLIDYRGTFVYPDPRFSREGEAFVMSVLMRNQDMEDWMTMPADVDRIKSLLEEDFAYLKQLGTYMYGNGERYPTSIREIDQLFFDETLLFSLTLNYNHATERLLDYEYPEGANTYVFNEGTHSYSEAMVIAHNAPNKSGALVALNALLSPEMQASKYDSRFWGSLPIYNPEFTPAEAYTEIRSVRVRPASIKQEDLLSRRIPEIPSDVRKIIIELWEELVLKTEA